MSNTIILKTTAVEGKVPGLSQIELGEVAINTFDGKMFIKKDDGVVSILEVGGVNSVNGQRGDTVLGTDEVAEGVTNLYHTVGRVRENISVTGSGTYDSLTGVIDIQGGVTSVNTQTGDVVLTTDEIAEGSNQYFTTTRARTSVSASTSTGVTYNSATGLIELASIPNSSLTNSSVTVNGSTVALGGSTSFDTDSVAEGSNLYYTDARVDTYLTTNAYATESYVDTAVSAVSTSSIAQGNSSVAVVDAGTGTVTVTVDGSTALTVNSTGVTVAGNFTVSGTTTTVNSNTVAIADNIITLNSDATGPATQDAGIEIERGDDANVQLRWNEGTNVWQFTNDGTVYYPIPTSTTVLAEGTNLYYTQARFDSAFSGKSTTNLTEGTNQYFTTARARSSISASGDLTYTSATGVVSFTQDKAFSSLTGKPTTIAGYGITDAYTKTEVDNKVAAKDNTDEITEGTTNLYFTTARARNALSFAAGSGAYNSTTGVITIPTNNNQLTNGANYTTYATVTGSTLDMGTNKILYSNYYATATDFPSAASYHGMFVHAHDTGSAYFSHAGSWIQLAKFNQIPTNYLVKTGDTMTGMLTVDVTGISSAANDLNLKTGAGHVSAIYAKASNQYVGIGKTTPARKLDVEGGARFVQDVAAPSGAIVLRQNAGNTEGAYIQWVNNENTIERGWLHVDVNSNMKFATNSTERVRIANTTGNVGINNTNPGSRLSVNGANSGSVPLVDLTATGTGGFQRGVRLLNSGMAASDSIMFAAGQSDSAINMGQFYFTYAGAGSTSNRISLGLHSVDDVLNVVGTSRVGIGNTAPAEKLHLTGNMLATGEITAYYSDRRLKENVTVIADPITKVLKLNGICYTPNELATTFGYNKDDKIVGLFADEVESVLPEAVALAPFDRDENGNSKSGENYKTVKYEKVVPLLVEAIKQQQAIIDSQNAKIDMLMKHLGL